jgi:hypothetical protein
MMMKKRAQVTGQWWFWASIIVALISFLIWLGILKQGGGVLGEMSTALRRLFLGS